MSEKNNQEIIASMALLYGNPECTHTPAPIPTRQPSIPTTLGHLAKKCKTHGEQTVPGSSLCLKCLREGVKPSTHPGRELRVGVACPHEGDCDNSPSCRQIYSQDLFEMDGTCRYFKGKPTHVFAQSP
ncbi:MAG: hypothetical protein HQL75_08170 [Magnetococcales bacterium]|nr:hypothetical protein [Magnetococcales bacterium]